MFRIFCSYRKFVSSVKGGLGMGLGERAVESESGAVDAVWLPPVHPSAQASWGIV